MTMRYHFIMFHTLGMNQNISEQYRVYSVVTEYLSTSSLAGWKHQVEIVSNILIEVRHQVVVVSKVDVDLVVVVVICINYKVKIY